MRTLAILLLIAGMAGAQGFPAFLDDLYPAADTLHVTTTEKGWALGAYSGAYQITFINPTAETFTFRFSTDGADTTFQYGGANSSFVKPEGIPAFWVAKDSVFIDGSGSFTLYIDWLEVR